MFPLAGINETEVRPKIESQIPNPQSPYAVSKLTGEYYCRVFYKVYQLETIALRYFNVFGQRQDANSHYAAVIPKFISALLDASTPRLSMVTGSSRGTLPSLTTWFRLISTGVLPHRRPREACTTLPAANGQPLMHSMKPLWDHGYQAGTTLCISPAR